jgi:hypothetical protein
MPKNRFISVMLCLCLPLLFCGRAGAWNSTGHEVVAQIAWDQLTPAVRKYAVGILKNHPRLNQDLLADQNRVADDNEAMFIRAATWPDMIRSPIDPMSRTENHPRWHYIDFPIASDGLKEPAPPLQWDGKSDPANLVEAMQKAVTELENPQTPAPRKAIDMCWVEHLVGDIHQPLHATSWFSKEYPQGDQGGNLDVIDLPNQPPENLHFYWDAIEGMSLDPAQIRKTADRIEAEHPESQLKDQVKDLSVVDWAQESFVFAKTVAYENGALPHSKRTPGTTLPSKAPTLSQDYLTKSLATADMRIALAGYRLAAVITQLAAGNYHP